MIAGWALPRIAFARALAIYRFLYVAFLILASIATLVQAQDRQYPALEFLAGLEIAAALLFLFRRSQLLGASLLAMIFIVAFVGDLATGGMPARFMLYLGTAIFILYLDRQSRGQESRMPAQFNTGDALAQCGVDKR